MEIAQSLGWLQNPTVIKQLRAEGQKLHQTTAANSHAHLSPHRPNNNYSGSGGGPSGGGSLVAGLASVHSHGHEPSGVGVGVGINEGTGGGTSSGGSGHSRYQQAHSRSNSNDGSNKVGIIFLLSQYHNFKLCILYS